MQKQRVKKVANRAMEIYRGKNTNYPLAICKAVHEEENLTEEQQLKLKKDVIEELDRRRQLVRDAKSHGKRKGNNWHGGPMSAIGRARKKIHVNAPTKTKVGNTPEERRRQKKLEQQTREAEIMAKERHDELLPDD